MEQTFGGGQGEEVIRGPAGSVENQLEAKINKIYKNEDLDNKQKIAQLVELFNNEVVTEYQKGFVNVVKGNADLTRYQYLSEFKHEKK